MQKNEIINLALYAGILKNVNRQGWVLKGIEDPESVADHTFRTAFLVMILSNDHPKLNQARMIKMALIHEIGESVVGDIVYEHGENIISPLVNKHKDERNALMEIFKTMSGKQEYIDLWEEWVAQETPEAKYVKCVEKLEMVIQAYEYEQKGHKPELFEEFWKNAWKYIRDSELEPILTELESMRKKKKGKKGASWY